MRKRKHDPFRSYISRAEVYDLIAKMSKTIRNRPCHKVQIKDDSKNRKIVLLYSQIGLPEGLDAAGKRVRNNEHTVELTITEGFITNSFGFKTVQDFYNTYQFNYGPEKRFSELSDYEAARMRTRTSVIQRHLRLRPKRY